MAWAFDDMFVAPRGNASPPAAAPPPDAPATRAVIDVPMTGPADLNATVPVAPSSADTSGAKSEAHDLTPPTAKGASGQNDARAGDGSKGGGSSWSFDDMFVPGAGTPAAAPAAPIPPPQQPSPPAASAPPPPGAAPSKPPVQVPGLLTGTANAAQHALTLGLDDPIGAAGGALGDWLANGKPFGQAYDDNLAAIRAQRQAFAQAHPFVNGAAQLVGGAALGAPVMGAGGVAAGPGLLDALFSSAPAGAPLGARALNFGRNMAASAALGGTAGFGAGEGGLQQRLASAQQGAEFGGGMGAILPGVGALANGVAGIGRNAYDAVAPLFSNAAREQTIGRNLTDMVGNAPIQSAPLPNVPLNLAQATNSPEAGALVRTAADINPGAAMTQATAQNQGIRDALGTQASPATSSAQFTDALRSAQDLSGTEGKRLWNAPELTQQPVQTQRAKNSMQDAEAQLRSSDPGMAAVLDHSPLVQNQLQALQNFPDAAPVRSLNSIRSQLLSIARAPASDPAAYMQRRLASYFAGKMFDAMDRTLSASTVAPEIKNAYTAARAFTAKEAPLFGTADAGRAFGKTKAGEFRVDASRGADGFFDFARGSGEGAQNINEIVSHLNDIEAAWKKAGSDMPLEDLQTARSALIAGARDYVVSSLIKNVELSGRDLNGHDMLNYPRMFDWFQTNMPWIKQSGLFSPAQIDVLAKVQQTAGMLARPTRPASNSTTFANIGRGKFLDELLSPWLKRASMVAGVTLGYHTEGAVGALAGATGAHALEALAGPARNALKQLMLEAVQNPQIAKDLMMKASRGNAKFLLPETRALMAKVAPAFLADQTAQKKQQEKRSVQ